MNKFNVDYNRIDPAVEERVDALLAQMTLAEKVGQLVQITAFKPFDVAAFIAQQKVAEETGQPFAFKPEIRDDLADLLRTGAVGSLFNLVDREQVNRFQRIAVEESRLKIPLIIGGDVIHGYRAIFPIPLAESCSWNPPLLERAARVAAEEASAAGIDWIFAPMVDIARDPRWGRIAEGAGEDPLIGRAMAQARVRGFQAGNLTSGRRIVACPKHYAGYGAAEAGRDYNTVELSERTLREVYLPPFKAAFDAGAGSVMSAFNEIGGVPATADPFLLRTVLRDEWQWPGPVVSDYNAIAELINHGVATDLKEAARLSILAGVDIDMMSNAYAPHLANLVEEGAVPLAVVDAAVRRVLRLKFQLGLFERPYVDEALAQEVLPATGGLHEDFRELALTVAQEAMVLLKNNNHLLPLSPKQRIAVIGPLAEARRDLLGMWVLNGRAEDADTVVDALRTYLSDAANLTCVAGCPLQGEGLMEIEAAVAAAQAADVVIAVVGEGHELSGEARSRAHLGLPGRQQELIDALAQTGKPLVVVLMCGRPLVIPCLAEQAGALLVGWHGGIRAGQAVADILFGAVNPSGKLTTTWPRAEGQIPVYYAHKNTGRPMDSAGTTQFLEPFKSGYLDEPNAPLFPFGYGLSYTTFTYRDLTVETPMIRQDGTLVVSASVQNTGERAGTEVVQLYVRDLVGSVTRPVKELKGFQRITLQPGETQTVRFTVPAQELGFWGPKLPYVVEPGAFKVWIGPNAVTGLEGAFVVQ
ncbi:MAG: glycoside hydrolase family 3 N-terminal domain-containing protein [Caldilineaceae bacterium]